VCLGFRYICIEASFLTAKDTTTIRRAFKSIFPNAEELDVALLVGDWEQALWNVARELFPQVTSDRRQKCQYHYTHNVQVNTKKNGKRCTGNSLSI
jgi:hypothetical protein